MQHHQASKIVLTMVFPIMRSMFGFQEKDDFEELHHLLVYSGQVGKLEVFLFILTMSLSVPVCEVQ